MPRVQHIFLSKMVGVWKWPRLRIHLWQNQGIGTPEYKNTRLELVGSCYSLSVEITDRIETSYVNICLMRGRNDNLARSQWSNKLCEQACSSQCYKLWEQLDCSHRCYNLCEHSNDSYRYHKLCEHCGSTHKYNRSCVCSLLPKIPLESKFSTIAYTVDVWFCYVQQLCSPGYNKCPVMWNDCFAFNVSPDRLLLIHSPPYPHSR